MRKRLFDYRSIPESEGQMYSDVKGVLIACGIEGKRLFNILLAISEAFTNALIHGNKYNPDKIIKVEIGINDKVIIADIIDEGTGFDEKRPDPRNSDLLSEGGRGVGLMRSIADRVSFEKSRRTAGMKISMCFERDKNKQIKSPDKLLEDNKMEITRRDEKNIMIISVSGRLDLGSGNRLKEEIKSVLTTGMTSIHLNLKEVEFVNSSGLGALVSIMKEIRIHRGRLTLSDMADYVREIFDITQLSHIFEIFTTEEEALHSYQPVVTR
jgi:anti-anti-sigma factor